MFGWKRRNDVLIVELLTKVLDRQNVHYEGIKKMVNLANSKLDQVNATLVTTGAGVNALIENNRLFAAALEEARSNNVDMTKLDAVYANATSIAEVVAKALNPTVPTPEVSELPVVQVDGATSAPEPAVTPVPTTTDPVGDLPTEAPTADTADAPAPEAGTDTPTDGGDTKTSE